MTVGLGIAAALLCIVIYLIGNTDWYIAKTKLKFYIENVQRSYNYYLFTICAQ